MSFDRTSTNWEGSRVGCTIREGAIDEISTITERWFVSRKHTGAMTPMSLPYDVESMRADAGGPVIPRVGAAYPTGAGATWQDACALRSVDIEPAQKGANFTLNYSTRYFYATNAKGLAKTSEAIGLATTLSAGLFLRASCTPTSRMRSTLAYRSISGGWSPSPTTDYDTADIAGDALGAGRGQQVDVRQCVLKIRMVVDTEISGQDLDSLGAIIDTCNGKKNSDTFLGYGAGYLICEGGALNHLEHEFYEFVLDFLWDEWAHKSQVPECGADGRPKMSGSAPSDVRFRREARAAVTFNDIWPASDLGKSYKYQVFRGNPF